MNDEKKTIKCAVYARTSSTQRGSSEQVVHARQFAASRGWTVLDDHVYQDDGICGTADLPAKARLVQMIESGEHPFDVLVMQGRDRFSRLDSVKASRELKGIAKAGVAIRFYGTGE